MNQALENLRPILWVCSLLLIWSCYQAWQNDYAPRAPATPVVAAGTAAPDTPPPQIPALQLDPGLKRAEAVEAAPAPPPHELVRVRTDVLDLQIDPVGGDIRAADLLTYPIHKDQPDDPVVLLSGSADKLFVFHTGLRAADGAPQPDYTASYRTDQTSYQLAADATDLEVHLVWQGQGGSVTAEKVFHFRRGRYDIGLEYRLHNGGRSPYRVASYLQIQRRHAPPARSYFNVDSYSYTGPVAYDGNKYEKIKLDKLATEPFKRTAVNGWIASIQHHFLAAAVPPPGAPYAYDIAWDGKIYTLGAIGPLQDVAPGADARFEAKLFVGPKLQNQLVETAEGLQRTADYGWLTILAQPLFWLLQKIHGVIGNWGWSIIIATFLIKLAFYKLTETSGRSMAKMRKIQPRLKALQERFKDDRQALSQAMMELYKKEKVSPAAGCLPMVIQIPFFIAYYWVLLESVEMRQAPFALWITDLSSRDPYFVLPLLMGVAMFVQQSLNPAPPDPIQAKVMKIMPVMFTGFFAFFPAGLVLYWLTNSILSILQQWRINKVLAAD